jgi:DNA-directed RNA polymerase subunit M/transcription elongation factor TFIIS
MHFCSKCHNMYYIKIFEDSNQTKKLVYYCRNCGNEETDINEGSVVVSKTNIKKGKQTFHHIINKYTKLDPTLPRLSNIDCPNQGCITNKSKDSDISTLDSGVGAGVGAGAGAGTTIGTDEENKGKNIDKEVIYIRYDNENMKYVYLCVHCDTVWQTNDKY